MPLVEENRQLHDKLRVLERVLADQQVAWDEFVSKVHPSAFAKVFQTIEVELEYADLIGHEDRWGTMKLVAGKITTQLMQKKLFRTLAEPGKLSMKYRFYVVVSPE